VLASQIDTETVSQQQSRTQPQSMDEQVQHVLHSLELLQLGRRQRELRTATADAERRGDQAMVDRLNIEKMKVDKQLRDQS